MKRSFLTILAAAAVVTAAACSRERKEEQVRPVEETTPMPAPAPAPPPIMPETMMTTTDTMGRHMMPTTTTGM